MPSDIPYGIVIEPIFMRGDDWVSTDVVAIHVYSKKPVWMFRQLLGYEGCPGYEIEWVKAPRDRAKVIEHFERSLVLFKMFNNFPDEVAYTAIW